MNKNVKVVQAVNATLRPPYNGKEAQHPFRGNWMVPQGESGRVRKISPSPGFDPLAVQPLAIRYTGCAPMKTVLFGKHVLIQAVHWSTS